MWNRRVSLSWNTIEKWASTQSSSRRMLFELNQDAGIIWTNYYTQRMGWKDKCGWKWFKHTLISIFKLNISVVVLDHHRQLITIPAWHRLTKTWSPAAAATTTMIMTTMIAYLISGWKDWIFKMRNPTIAARSWLLISNMMHPLSLHPPRHFHLHVVQYHYLLHLDTSQTIRSIPLAAIVSLLPQLTITIHQHNHPATVSIATTTTISILPPHHHCLYHLPYLLTAVTIPSVLRLRCWPMPFHKMLKLVCVVDWLPPRIGWYHVVVSCNIVHLPYHHNHWIHQQQRCDVETIMLNNHHHLQYQQWISSILSMKIDLLVTRVIRWMLSWCHQGTLHQQPLFLLHPLLLLQLLLFLLVVSLRIVVQDIKPWFTFVCFGIEAVIHEVLSLDVKWWWKRQQPREHVETILFLASPFWLDRGSCLDFPLFHRTRLSITQ